MHNDEIMDPENKPEVKKIITSEHHGGMHVRTVCFSPDQTKLCSSGKAGNLVLTDLKSEDYKEIKCFKGHKTTVWGSEFSFDGEFVVTVSADSNVGVFEVNSEHGNYTKLEGHKNGVRSLRCFGLRDSDVKAVTGGEDRTIRVWSVERTKETSVLDGHEGYIHTLDLLPDDNTLVSGDSRKKVKFWDLRSGECVKVLENHHSSCIYCVQFHSETHSLASGSFDKSIRIIDYRTFQELHKYPNVSKSTVRSLCFHEPSGRYLLSGCSDATMKIIDLSEKKVIYTLSHPRTKRFSSVKFSPDGMSFASACGDDSSKLMLWSFPLGRPYLRRVDADEEERIKYLQDSLEEEEIYGVLKLNIDQLCTLYCFKFLLFLE